LLGGRSDVVILSSYYDPGDRDHRSAEDHGMDSRGARGWNRTGDLYHVQVNELGERRPQRLLADAELLPEEEKGMLRAVEKRRREFIAGRACARRALGRLGIPPVSILSGDGPSREWPVRMRAVTCCFPAPSLCGYLVQCDPSRSHRWNRLINVRHINPITSQ
jgi:hypothetical protein